MISLHIPNFKIVTQLYSNIELQELYTTSIAHFNFSECHCECGSNHWHYHAYYERFLIVNGHRYLINVTRIKCTSCGCTHVVLPIFIIPYHLRIVFDCKLYSLIKIIEFIKFKKRLRNFLIFSSLPT